MGGLDVQRGYFMDVLGLDEELLALVPHRVVALVLLYPTTTEAEEHLRRGVEVQLGEALPESKAKVFFLRQLAGGTCGTIAVLHAIANNLTELGSGAVRPEMPLTALLKDIADGEDTTLVRSQQLLESTALRAAQEATCSG